MKPYSNYKDILINLTLRNLSIKYKGSALGFFWIFLGPILFMAILGFVFTKIIRIQMDKYPLFLLSGILPWAFFSSAVSEGTTSIIENANLVKKVYFSREILPIACVMSNFIDFIFRISVFIPALIIFKAHIGIPIILLPGILIIHLMFTMGLVLLLSCVNVYLRDINHMLSFVLALWFYITPIFYPLSMVPRNLYNIYLLNPLTPIITMYRNVLFEGKMPIPAHFFISLMVAVVTLITGYSVFKKYQSGFAKEI